MRLFQDVLMRGSDVNGRQRRQDTTGERTPRDEVPVASEGQTQPEGDVGNHENQNRLDADPVDVLEVRASFSKRQGQASIAHDEIAVPNLLCLEAGHARKVSNKRRPHLASV
jgi:hypothetical protein